MSSGPVRPARRTAGLIAAVVLPVVLLILGWRVFDLVRENTRLNPLTAPGPIDASGFRYLEVDPETGRPARYNPCEPLRYVVNLSDAPADALNDVQEAAQLASEASGIDIVYEGASTELPSLTRSAFIPDLYGDRWPPVLIAWMPQDPRVFREHDVGAAASDAVENSSGELVYVTGNIILNADKELSSGFSAGRTWGKVILHEWGHILGLDHVDNPTQVMHASLVSSPARWGTGDEAGLRAVGRPAGCVDSPELP
jgi:hypothetical protein